MADEVVNDPSLVAGEVKVHRWPRGRQGEVRGRVEGGVLVEKGWEVGFHRARLACRQLEGPGERLSEGLLVDRVDVSERWK